MRRRRSRGGPETRENHHCRASIALSDSSETRQTTVGRSPCAGCLGPSAGAISGRGGLSAPHSRPERRGLVTARRAAAISSRHQIGRLIYPLQRASRAGFLGEHTHDSNERRRTAGHCWARRFRAFSPRRPGAGRCCLRPPFVRLGHQESWAPFQRNNSPRSLVCARGSTAECGGDSLGRPH